jgi:exonuclease VII small subunit
MTADFSKWLVLAALVIGLTASASAQSAADNRPISSEAQTKDDQPLSVKEMFYKMQIEQAIKEHDQMIERGEEALRLTDQVERSFSQSKTITHRDSQRLQEVEKLVKKIRKELGGGDDDPDEESSGAIKNQKPSSLGDGIKALQSTAGTLVEELKKTSRFSISAAAIQSSNAVLKIVRFLRISK